MLHSLTPPSSSFLRAPSTRGVIISVFQRAWTIAIRRSEPATVTQGIAGFCRVLTIKLHWFARSFYTSKHGFKIGWMDWLAGQGNWSIQCGTARRIEYFQRGAGCVEGEGSSVDSNSEGWGSCHVGVALRSRIVLLLIRACVTITLAGLYIESGKQLMVRWFLASWRRNSPGACLLQFAQTRCCERGGPMRNVEDSSTSRLAHLIN